jgi:hypothetical protein
MPGEHQISSADIMDRSDIMLISSAALAQDTFMIMATCTLKTGANQ